jgi:hypothetical protein
MKANDFDEHKKQFLEELIREVEQYRGVLHPQPEIKVEQVFKT